MKHAKHKTKKMKEMKETKETGGMMEPQAAAGKSKRRVKKSKR